MAKTRHAGLAQYCFWDRLSPLRSGSPIIFVKDKNSGNDASGNAGATNIKPTRLWTLDANYFFHIVEARRSGYDFPMRPISFQLYSALPALIALLFVLLSATPMEGGELSYTPNVAWLMTLVMVTHYPPAWPRGFAFLLGLLQDVLFGTPLGSQAILTLLLAQATDVQAHRNQSQVFRLRWLEAAGMLVVWHVLLWALIHLTTHDGASLRHLVRMGLINALWFPLFYKPITWLFAALPDAK